MSSHRITATPIIMHLEHTGGTTMREVVKRQYGDGLYMIFYDDPKSARKLMESPESARVRYRAYLGHLFYGLHRWVPGESTYLTWLRDPIERIVSGYYFFYRKPRKPNYARYNAGEVSWEEHLGLPWRSIAQAGRIAGGDDDLVARYRMNALPPNATETALANLERDFALVGLTERYDETLLLMAQRLGWTQPLVYVRLNVGKNRPRFADLSAPDRVLIERAAEVESPLYEYARARFESELARYEGDIERDLAEFRQANAQYNERLQARQRVVNQVKAPFRRAKRWAQSRVRASK